MKLILVDEKKKGCTVNPSNFATGNINYNNEKCNDNYIPISDSNIEDSLNSKLENSDVKGKIDVVKSVLIVLEFLEEELEFLEEERISIQDSDSKWSWLTSELAEKYFISVLLPYYIIKPNLSYEELFQLGFKAFISKLKR